MMHWLDMQALLHLAFYSKQSLLHDLSRRKTDQRAQNPDLLYTIMSNLPTSQVSPFGLGL